MNLKEIIELVKPKREKSWSAGELYEDLTGSHEWIDADHAVRLTEANYTKWLCTDTAVGKVIYFLGDEAVAVSTQEGRKCRKKFTWISRRTAEMTRDYLLTLIPVEEELFDVFTPEDLEEDIGKGYFVSFGSHYLTNDVCTFDDDVPVTIVKVYVEYEDIDFWNYVVVKFSDGSKKIMEIMDLYIPYGK